MSNYVIPKFDESAFNCPYCDAYAHQKWTPACLSTEFLHIRAQTSVIQYSPLFVCRCEKCGNISVWFEQRIIHPAISSAPNPAIDMPDDVKKDYEEARQICNVSPKAAAALLRLAVQRLMPHLGEKGKKIDDDIGSLVQKGLPVDIQQALDIVRVIGNNAVHPGTIDINDDMEIVETLFSCINITVEYMITNPRKIRETFQKKIPQNTKEAIDKRDGKKP